MASQFLSQESRFPFCAWIKMHKRGGRVANLVSMAVPEIWWMILVSNLKKLDFNVNSAISTKSVDGFFLLLFLIYSAYYYKLSTLVYILGNYLSRWNYSNASKTNWVIFCLKPRPYLQRKRIIYYCNIKKKSESGAKKVDFIKIFRYLNLKMILAIEILKYWPIKNRARTLSSKEIDHYLMRLQVFSAHVIY